MSDDLKQKTISRIFIDRGFARALIQAKELTENDLSTVYDKYLLPPNGRSCAENIYHDLLLSLGFEK